MLPERCLHVRLDVFLQCVRFRLEYKQIAQVRNQIRHETHHIFPGVTLLMQQIDRARSFSSQNSPRQIDNCLVARESEYIEHIVLADFLPAKCDELIEHRFRVAQTTLGSTRNRVRSCGFE